MSSADECLEFVSFFFVCMWVLVIRSPDVYLSLGLSVCLFVEKVLLKRVRNCSE